MVPSAVRGDVERGELAIFKTSAQAIHVQAMFDHLRVNKHRVSAGPPPAWLQKQRNTFMPEDGDKARQTRLVIMNIISPWLLSSYLLTGIFFRGYTCHKNVVVRVAMGHVYPIIVHMIMLHCTYTCFDEALRELASDENSSTANAIRAFANGLFLFLTEMVYYVSKGDFMRPISDNSLMRIMMLNVRPETSDVAYLRKVVKVLTVKGIVGVFVFVPFVWFCLWHENRGDGSIFFVARDPTPRLVFLSVAMFVASANIHVMFSRTSLYSLVTRCVSTYNAVWINKHTSHLL